MKSGFGPDANEKRAVIFRETDSCGSEYVLCAGRLKLSTTGADGRILIQRTARAGEIPGPFRAACLGTTCEL